MINLQKLKNESIILGLSILISSFFLFLFMNANYFNINSILLGVVQELITLPMMLLLLILLIYTAFRLIKSKSKFDLKILTAFIILLVCTYYTWGSILGPK